jgi:hypothetical protein
MGRFEVVHAYTAHRDGRQFGPWAPDEFVELDQADADWVNRDSPGCLLAAGGILEDAQGDAAAVEQRPKPAGRDRQHRGGTNRG